jgi:hypothetical protein
MSYIEDSTGFAPAEVQKGSAGYVYILAARGLNVALCKIGRTTKDPKIRCAEINNSSTGDILWDLKYAVSVNNCIRYEALIHQELDQFRQRGREMFGLTVDDAYERIKMILDPQDMIEIAPPVKPRKASKCSSPCTIRRRGDEAYSSMLDTFKARMGGATRAFGQQSHPSFGLCDDAKGVQWNFVVRRDLSEAHLGVNLEGVVYNGSIPIMTLIESELKRPSLEAMKAKVEWANAVIFSFARDAWRVTARPDIKEHHFGGRRHLLTEVTPELWNKMLVEARDCFRVSRGSYARIKQWVTAWEGGEWVRKEYPVCPHLHIGTVIEINPTSRDQEKIDRAMDEAFARLRPFYRWVFDLTGQGR